MNTKYDFNSDTEIQRKLLKFEKTLPLSIIFSGSDKIAKKQAADFLASKTGKEILRIDISKIISKYIGETEKNLREIFDAAEQGGSVLLFDEADTLFGKRTNVKDSHDRYANTAISYLFQRLESFKGTIIISLNDDGALKEDVMNKFNSVIRFPVNNPYTRGRMGDPSA